MDKEYYDTIKQLNDEYLKSRKRKNFIEYIKGNILSIIAIIVSIIALFK